MTSRMADSPAAQAARDNRDENLGKPTGQAAPEPTGTYAAAQEKAKADRQPRVDQSAQVKTMMAALRMQESGSYDGDYIARGKWIEQQTDKSIGAYGIMSKNWNAYTNAAGIPNANWRDPASQDRVAGQMVQKLAGQFAGNWGLVAAAWFAGAHVTDRVVGKYGYQATPEQISEVLGPTIGDYASQVVGHGTGMETNPYGIEHNLPSFSKDAGFSRPKSRRLTNTTPQDAVRARLVTLAGMSGKEMVAEDVTADPNSRESEYVPTEGATSGGRWTIPQVKKMEEEKAAAAAKAAEAPTQSRNSSNYDDLTYEERGDMIADLQGQLSRYEG